MTGPVQVLVVGFEEPSMSGELLAELNRLGDAGIVRLLDVLLVARDADGGLEVLPPPPGADPDLGRLTAALLGEAGEADLTEPGEADPMVLSLENAVPEGGTAAIALIEHTWAQPLVQGIRRQGGRLLDETWLAPDDVELLDRLAVSARSSHGQA